VSPSRPVRGRGEEPGHEEGRHPRGGRAESVLLLRGSPPNPALQQTGHNGFPGFVGSAAPSDAPQRRAGRRAAARVDPGARAGDGRRGQHPRLSASPFLDEATRAAIAATCRQHLVIAGFATEVVVLHGVRDAIAAGYRAYVPVDACGGMSSRTEDAALRQIEAAGGVTTSVVSLVTAMAPDFAQEPGRNTLAALQALRSA
jgi:hypothetical protein